MRCSSRTTMGAWAKPTTATFRILEPVEERFARRVGLARRPEVLDVLVVALALAVRLPDGLDAHPHAHVLGFALLDHREDRDVGAVERDRGRDVRDLDVPADDGDVDDAERRHDPAVGDLDELLARGEALRRGDDRRDEDLARLRATPAEDLLLLQRLQIARAAVARDVVVRQVDRRLDVLDGFLRRLAHEITLKCAMSRMLPIRCSSGAHTASTRVPTRSCSTPSFTACAIAVSAPSSLTSTNANGAGNGWRPSTA